MLSGEAAHTNFFFFFLTRPESELMIYRTRGEHAKISPPIRSKTRGSKDEPNTVLSGNRSVDHKTELIKSKDIYN